MKFIQVISILSALATGTSYADNVSNDGAATNNNERQDTDLSQNQTPENDTVRQYFETEAAEGTEEENTPSKYAQATDNSGTGASASSPTGPTSDNGTAAPTATPTKVKKKKKKPIATEETAATSGHGTQESGLPYKAAVDMNLKFASESKTKKYSDKSLKESKTTLGLDLDYLFVFGHMEVGPKIAFLSQTEKEPADSETKTTKTSGIGFGAALVLNIGNIHQDSLVPYVDLDIIKESKTETKSISGISGSDKTTDSDMRIGLGGGMKFFMGGHIALKPFLKYELIMSGQYKNEVTATDATVASVTGSNLSLGMGLAKYF